MANLYDARYLNVRPFYSINIDDDEEVKKWLNGQYSWRTSSEHEQRRISKQTTNIALYLNYSPAPKKALTVSQTGDYSVFERREYQPLFENLFSNIVDDWASRLTARKPVFNTFPKDAQDAPSKAKVETVREVLEAKFQEQEAIALADLAAHHMVIFGESFLEIFWDPTIGPLDPDIQAVKDLEDENDDEEYDESNTTDDYNPQTKTNYSIMADNTMSGDGNAAVFKLPKSAYQMRIGDIAFKLHDPRNVIVQQAPSNKQAEWTMLLELHPVEKIKIKYPSKADLIKTTQFAKVFTDEILFPSYAPDYVLVYNFYHKATMECPKGYHIIATPDAILQKDELPCDNLWKYQRFPVLQITDNDVLGTSRGFASTLDNIATAQIALNCVWMQTITSMGTWTPKLLMESNSMDVDHLRIGDRNIIKYKRGSAKPELLIQELVSQGQLAIMDKLRDRILKGAKVLPISQGDSTPNMESRKMMDYYQEQENSQSIPKDVKYKKFLEDWARVTLDFMVDWYQPDEVRTIQYFGKLSQQKSQIINIKDLDVNVDLNVETQSALSQTLDGRIAQITQLASIAPGIFTPAELIDKLELGSPQKMYDAITAAIDSAEKEIADLLMGKTVKAPTKRVDLIAYYDVYVKAMQQDSIKKILPDIFDPEGTDIGNMFLNQVATIEMLLLDVIQEKGQIPLIIPQYNLPPNTTLIAFIYGRYPSFPSVYDPDDHTPVNPFDARSNAIGNDMAPGLGPTNPMPSAIEPLKPSPSEIGGRPQPAGIAPPSVGMNGPMLGLGNPPIPVGAQLELPKQRRIT